MSDTEYEEEIALSYRSSTPARNPRHLTLPLPLQVSFSTSKTSHSLPLRWPWISHFLLHIAEVHPAHTDRTLQAVQILIQIPSLPLINNWDSSRPNATFQELFRVAFREDVNASVCGHIEVGERESYIAASLLAARARSLGMLNTPATGGSLAEGLRFSDAIRLNYQGDEAEIAAIGSCIQLLGSVLPLMRDQPERFAKYKILAALDGLHIPSIDMLIKLTKSHFDKGFLADLTSEEIVHELKGLGWRFPGDRY